MNLKLIKYIISLYRLSNIGSKIKTLQIKQNSLKTAIDLGFADEREFISKVKNFNSRLEYRDLQEKISKKKCDDDTNKIIESFIKRKENLVGE